MPLQIRRGTDAERLLVPQPLAAGELAYTTDTGKLFIGDGATMGGIQVTGFDAKNAIDAAGGALVAGIHKNISFTYGTEQEVAGRIDATVSLSQLLSDLNLNNNNIVGTGLINITGRIYADAFVGSVFPDASALGGRALVDAIDASINLDSTIKGNVIPSVNGAYDLGANSFRFKNLYLGGNNLYLGGATITAVGATVDLPVNSTIGGVPLGIPTDASLNVDITGSVFGENSAVIIDATESSLHTDAATYVSDSIIVNSNFLNITHPDPAFSVAIRQTMNGPKDNFIINGITNGVSGIGTASYITRGTSLAPTAVTAGDALSFDTMRGYDGSNYVISSIIGNYVDNEGTVSAGSVPGKVVIATFADGSTPVGIAVNHKGWLSINNITGPIGATLDINGFAKLAVLTAEPTTPADGMVAIADGTGWDPLLNGKQSLVVRLGGSWVSLASAA